jgi:hypothetical protein
MAVGTEQPHVVSVNATRHFSDNGVARNTYRPITIDMIYFQHSFIVNAAFRTLIA